MTVMPKAEKISSAVTSVPGDRFGCSCAPVVPEMPVHLMVINLDESKL